MPVKTSRKRSIASRRKDGYYDVGIYRGGRGMQISRIGDSGEVVKEAMPKNIYRPAISPQGNLVNVVCETDVNQRSLAHRDSQRIQHERESEGFIWADTCPIESGILDSDQQRKLFGPNVKPCKDHDFNWKLHKHPSRYRPPVICKHLEKIQEVNRAEHESNMERARVAAMSEMAKQQGLTNDALIEMVKLFKEEKANSGKAESAEE